METEKKPLTWEETVISVPNHSQSASCPYCGEEFGIESEIEGTRRDQAHETWQARQPEIDRLKAEISDLKDRLKADVDYLQILRDPVAVWVKESDERD